MTFIDLIAEQNPNAKTADGFDDCIIGIANRYGMEPVLAYSRPAVIKVLMERDELSHDEAQEHFDVNIIGAWVGDGTPIFVDTEL
jgi:hypothetical protein